MSPDGVVDLGNAQQLDDVAQSPRHGDVAGGDATDAFVVHVAGDHLRSERDRRHDRRLGRGIETFDVGRGITLGESQRLRLGEGDAVVGAFLRHLGEDEVGGAVDDPHHTGDRLAAQALAQHADDRDAAGNGGFEQQVDTGVVADTEQLGADVGQQLLVGGDDRFARTQRVGDELARRLDAADHFDDEVDARVRHHGVGVAGEHTFGEVHIALAAEVTDGHRAHLQPHAGASLDGRLLRGHQVDERRSDVAASQHSDPHELCHGRKATG